MTECINSSARIFACLREGLFSLALSIVAASALAMDCGNARHPVERVVCGHPDLLALDNQLNDRYQIATLVRADADGFLRIAQHDWLKERNLCSDHACVQQKYEQRLAQLASLTPLPDVWLRSMPGKFQEGWLFYAADKKGSPFIAGEPIWLVNQSERAHSAPPFKISEQWWDISYALPQYLPYRAHAGKRVEIFCLFDGPVLEGAVGVSGEVVLSTSRGDEKLIAIPDELRIRMKVSYMDGNVAKAEFSRVF